MNEEHDFFIVFVVSLCLLIVGGFLGGYTMGKKSGIKEHRIEAVKQGAAEWKVNEKGNTSFQWIVKTEE
jgi:hypothetical protein